MKNIELVDILWKPIPVSSDSYGEEGWAAHDDNYFYVYTEGKWWRRQFSNFEPLEEF